MAKVAGTRRLDICNALRCFGHVCLSRSLWSLYRVVCTWAATKQIQRNDVVQAGRLGFRHLSAHGQRCQDDQTSQRKPGGYGKSSADD